MPFIQLLDSKVNVYDHLPQCNNKLKRKLRLQKLFNKHM